MPVLNKLKNAGMPLVAGLATVAIAAAAALLFESVYDLSFKTRPPDPLMAEGGALADGARGEPLALRLVDSGGVGIPVADWWGTDYSHARRVFHDVILSEPPFVDEAAFQRVEREWHAYVERMLDYGNNAIAVPLLLELIDFDRVNASTAAGGVPVYAADSPFRRRHDALRRRFGPLFEWTAHRGMQVFLDADMLTLTPPLLRHLRSVAPDRRPPGINPRDPAVWDVYRAGLEELFDTMPFVQGLVIRFGEGGDLYNTEGWPYRSEMTVRSAPALQALLRGLLPLFEARQKTLILRSWTVGVGALGRLHVDPVTYESILGPIDSPALVVSTKVTAGDFFSYLPLNPTLAGGRHRRIVELQAKPEFEGFGAFPNFLGDEHARALRALRHADSKIDGTYILTQFGGPLRAGPRTLYPLHGFWLWTDANVFIASRIAADPDANTGDLVRQWARARFGEDPRIVDAIASALIGTRRAVLEGFYIRPFAERHVRVPGIEVPPLMWIFEWDMVGGWSSLSSVVYRGCRDDVARAIAEGHEATAIVQKAHQQLEAAFQAAGPAACGDPCRLALRSFEYQETLFEVLAAWRQVFLSYYHWLDTGDEQAWNGWLAGRQLFEQAATRHVARFGADQEFPAFDLSSAERAITFAGRASAARLLSGGLLVVVIVLLAIGSPLGRRMFAPAPGLVHRIGGLTWNAVVTPWRAAQQADTSAAIAVCLLALQMLVTIVATLTSFASAWIAVAASLPPAAAAIAFASTTVSIAGRRGLLLAALGPSIAGQALILALIAFFGPIGFSYSFWIDPVFRVVLLTTVAGIVLWTSCIMLAARPRDHWSLRIGGALAAAGAGLATLTLMLPDWISVLRYLDRPLNLVPATDTMLFALRTYAGVSLDVGRSSLLAGAILLAAGYGMWLFAALSGRRR